MICGAVVLTLFNAAALASVSSSIIMVTSVVVGGLVASRRPENPIGWLFLGGALFSTLRELTAQYVVYGIETNPGALPLIRTATGFSNSIEIVGPVLLFIMVPLYFPSGRPVSERWGLVAWLALGGLPVVTVLRAVSPGEAVFGTGIPNPWAAEALRPFVKAIGSVGLAYYMGLIFASVASLVLRFWRSRGEERQQIKWFTFAASFVPVWFLTNTPIEEASLSLFLVMDALVIATVSAGIAILRYRLYDIDLLINRTLVYAALTATLVLIYLGGVVVLQRALAFLTGEGSQLAVVASTLVIAALFNPLRRRIQGFIDRRFYRRKYDARKTLEAFSAKLREETDLDALSGELMNAAVRETMRPAHVPVWLREPGKSK
jgi:hypothetical protein